MHELKWVNILDREYLEDYEQREIREFVKLVRRIHEGKFSFEKDRYPPDERFVNIQKPVAMTSLRVASLNKIWAQVPFSGSLILVLPTWPLSFFEESLFESSDIPKIIDFIKETGRIQVVLNDKPTSYEGLDYLDPFFKELSPPVLQQAPITILGNEKEIRTAVDIFNDLGRVRFFDFWAKSIYEMLGKEAKKFYSRTSSMVRSEAIWTYVALKLQHYTHPLAEDIENLMIDDPAKAQVLIGICQHFLVAPLLGIRGDLDNYAMDDIIKAHILPSSYRPKDIRFPIEIGKFLLKKLTYIPQDMRACLYIIDNYENYDLQKVQKSLNEAIVTNHPDIVNKSAEEFSEILDNVWNDPTIPRRMKNLKRGIPISVAAIGSAVSAFTGGLEGFLAGLGFGVGAKYLDVEIEGISENLAKFFSRSYQANVYDFKKEYKAKIRE